MGTGQHILIIGGGFAGATAAQELHKQGFHNVTLIDRKDYFEVTYAAMRGVTEPDNWGKRCRIRYQDFLKGRFIQGNVTELTDKTVTLEDGSQLNFDFVVLATGSSYRSFPIGKSNDALTLDDRNKEFDKHYTRLAKAASVLIVGGGPVGVEFAGEVADHFPNAKVTLVHGGRQLLNGFSEKAGRRSEGFLKKLGVDVHLDTRLTQGNDGVFSSGSHSFTADQVYFCGGATPNTAMLKKHFASALDDHDRLMVEKDLRVQGKEHIFAVGDCANVPELKLGYLAVMQGTAVARNIVRLIKGKSLMPYKTNPDVALIPVGRKQGLVQAPFGVTTLNCLVNMKQKDLFISKSFKGLGIKATRL